MSEIKVNKISPRTACGTTTLGDSGDTFTIPAGVTITNSGTAAGFGATGAVSWDTTVKTSGFTAVDGVGYFVNTTAGAISVNLPAGTAGAVVGFKDYTNTFDSNAVTLVQNGSDKIGGSAVNATLSTEGLAVTLVFIDATRGWLVTDNGTQDTASTAQYVTATGGTITCSGDYRIHTFTGPGALCVSNAGNSCGSNTVDYLIIGGAGGGGRNRGGGGGAGGYRESPGVASGSYSVSPLGVAPAVALPVAVTPYPVAVGGGGAASANQNAKGCNGSNSVFNTITSTGGGGGGSARNCSPIPVSYFKWCGANGGSGGGASGYITPVGYTGTGGIGNTPPVSPPQGNNGGTKNTGGDQGGGGAGGATGVGENAPTGLAGAGGAGATSSINASSVTRAGGAGGGSTASSGAPQGGSGGGGNGGYPGLDGVNGTTNLGSGGGGGSGACSGAGAGGSGIVIIRYKFQN
jgi:hypothetical protein